MLYEMIDKLADPWIIFQDAHLITLSEDCLPRDGIIVRVLLKQGEDVIGALNLLLVVSQKLQETLKEARLQFSDLVGISVSYEDVYRFFDCSDLVGTSRCKRQGRILPV